MSVFKCAGRKRLDDSSAPFCTFESHKRWTGPCPGCGRYYDCEKIGAERHLEKKVERVTAAAAAESQTVYIPTGISGFDQVIGGGLVESCVILAGGERGAGKSSLTSQVAQAVAENTKQPVLYASGEEDVAGVLKVFRRNGVTSERVEVMGNAFDIDAVIERCEELKPRLAIFDSLQVMTDPSTKGSEGSTAQGEAVANIITGHCKRTGMCAIIINHMTKLGEFKGSTEVEHLVDTIVMLANFNAEVDGDPEEIFGKRQARELDELSLRVFMVDKNRNGQSHLKSYFAMSGEGRLVAVAKKSKLELV